MVSVNEPIEYDDEGSDGCWPEDIVPEEGLAVGYAPGGYLNTCRTCEGAFIGDKRARICAKCARVAIYNHLKNPTRVTPPLREQIARIIGGDDIDLSEMHMKRSLETADEILNIIHGPGHG